MFGSRKYLDIPQGTIGYHEIGHGAAVVLIHGVACNGSAWRAVAPALADQWRCIAPDFPMGSHSPAVPDADLSLPGQAEIVVGVLDALGLDRAVVVGNGYGADIAQIVAARHPDRVAALVLVASNVDDSYHWTAKSLVALAKLPGAEAMTRRLLPHRAFQRLPITYGWVTKRPIPDSIMAEYVGPAVHDRAIRRDLHRFLREVTPEHLARASAHVRRFERPALVVSPDEDKLFPREAARKLAADLPLGEFATIADSYAWVPEDQPAELVRLLREFLATAVRSGTTNHP
ncbi:alpha/beta fold hydrolase [Nocardia sp. NPDC127579]|uniref:alpha/beta fold hydrolase n=1 Tax=Nocardia sp. NPDC127579 TaxID=3345402 RepID=UPI00363449EE